MLGEPAQGRADCQQAIAIHGELGSLNGQANAWHSTGLAERHLGNLAGAVECFRRALGIYDELGRRQLAAFTLADLGDTLDTAGDPEGAREAWRRAQDILDDMHHSDAAQVRAKLERAGQRDPGPPAGEA